MRRFQGHVTGRSLLNAGLTGLQSYVSAEGIAGSHGSAIEVYILPLNSRFMAAFPMRFFSDPESQIAHVIDGFARSREKAPAGFPMQDGFYDTFVLDLGSTVARGGTGKAFDCESAESIADCFRRNGVQLLVAGGLTADIVGNAIGILKPWGVDVSSGAEARPGKKDAEKVRAVVRAVREMDRKVG